MRRASGNKSKEMNDMERTITTDHPRATKKGEEHKVKDNTNMKRKHLKHWATQWHTRQCSTCCRIECFCSRHHQFSPLLSKLQILR